MIHKSSPCLETPSSLLYAHAGVGAVLAACGDSDVRDVAVQALPCEVEARPLHFAPQNVDEEQKRRLAHREREEEPADQEIAPILTGPESEL